MDVRDLQQRVTERRTDLLRIATALPQPGENDPLPGFLRSLLRSYSSEAQELRESLGLPRANRRASELCSLLSDPSDHGSIPAILTLLVQRTYSFLGRLHSILVAESEAAASERVQTVLLFLEKGVYARPPMLDDLGALSSERRDLGLMAESPADPALYAVLRALSLDDRNPSPMPRKRREELRETALARLETHLSDAVDQRVDLQDTSNGWWAARLILRSKREKALPLLEKVISRWGTPRTITTAQANRSFAPEIYTTRRAVAFTLTNAALIRSDVSVLKPSLLPDLDAVMHTAARTLMERRPARHVYLLATEFEALAQYLHVREEQWLERASATGVDLAQYCEPPGYLCVDDAVRLRLRELRQWLVGNGRPARAAVFIGGPSGSGKTELVRSLLPILGEKREMCDDIRVLCTQEFELAYAALEHVAERQKARSPAYFYLDDTDAELTESMFKVMFTMVENGNVGDTPVPERCVVFWAGTFGATDWECETALKTRSKTMQGEKAIDLFTRSKRVILRGLDLEPLSTRILLACMMFRARGEAGPFRVASDVVARLRSLRSPVRSRDVEQVVHECFATGDEWSTGATASVTAFEVR